MLKIAILSLAVAAGGLLASKCTINTSSAAPAAVTDGAGR